MTVISNSLFSTHNVVVFKIPPGDISLSKWNTTNSNYIWKGSLRLIEQEMVQDDIAPYKGLRLKLELFNNEKLTLLLEDFTEVETEVQWAEVWYNPPLDGGFSIANNGDETIKMTPESPKYYKIITQLPGTGYHPFEVPAKDPILQVALGLKFEDSFSAVTFVESMGIYRRRFRNVQDKYQYDKHLLTLQQKILSGLRVQDESREPTPGSDFDDDDFGNFVGSSYD